MPAFIFGDVHGDAVQLRRLISKVRHEAGPDVDLYSVGDLVDRGQDSRGVIETCIEEGVKPILGNHELWFRDLVSGKGFDTFALQSIMGGKATLASYGINSPDPVVIERDAESRIPAAHREYILDAPFHRKIEVGGRTYRLTHGGISAKDGNGLWESVTKHITDVSVACSLIVAIMATEFLDRMIWVGAKQRNVFRFPDGSIQVFGHTPWRDGAEINVDGGYIALDTGCGTCPPFRLSGVLLTDDGGQRIISA